MDYVVLGRNIRKYRQMCGLRQEDLAERCGCGNSHIGQIGLPEGNRGTYRKISGKTEDLCL